MTVLVKRRKTGQSWPQAFPKTPEDVDYVLEPYFGEMMPGQVVGSCPVDVWEDDDHIFIEAELPGMTKDDIELTLDRGLVMINCHKKCPERQGEDDLRERYFGRTYRCLTLPTAVNEAKVDATMKNGILNITLFKTNATKPNRIQIR